MISPGERPNISGSCLMELIDSVKSTIVSSSSCERSVYCVGSLVLCSCSNCCWASASTDGKGSMVEGIVCVRAVGEAVSLPIFRMKRVLMFSLRGFSNLLHQIYNIHSTKRTTMADQTATPEPPTPQYATPSLPASTIIGGAPVRQWLNSEVTESLLEGMRLLARDQPKEPLKVLGEFLIAENAKKQT